MTNERATPIDAGLRRTLAGAVAMGVAIAGATAAPPSRAADSWQAYTYWGTPTVVASKGFRRIVEDIEQASGGELKIKFNLGGTLSINAANITSAVGDDIVQLADDAFFQGSVPISSMANLPFLARSVDDMHKVMAIVRPLAERDFAKKGVTALGYYVYPPQVFWFRDNVSSLAQLKGRKIRVSSAEQGEVVKAFGATPVQLGSADVPAALERGIVDGILTASSGGVLAWKELLKSSYVMNVNHVISWVVVNTDRFKKLPAATQTKIRDVVSRNLAEQTAELQREDVELRKRFASEGIAMTEAKPEENAHGEQVAKAAWDGWAKARGPEAIETLAKARQALGR